LPTQISTIKYATILKRIGLKCSSYKKSKKVAFALQTDAAGLHYNIKAEMREGIGIFIEPTLFEVISQHYYESQY
jgi:hypothetical protein